MKKFSIAVIIIAIAAILGYGIKYAVSPVNTQQLEYVTIENAINTNGFIIRDEWVMYSRSSGTVYHAVSEGDRVSKDSLLGYLFYGEVAEDTIKELKMVDNKLKNAVVDKSGSTFSALDSSTVENNIYERENDIIDAARDNDIVSISKYKRDINSLRQNNTLASDNGIGELQAKKDQILGSIEVLNDGIGAQISGVFTMYADGYEEILKPSQIESYDVQFFESLSQSPQVKKISNKVDAGGAVCKIVNNHGWYVMMDIPAEMLAEREVGDDVKLRFNNMADAVVDGSIYSISAEQNGRAVVTVKCPEYLESALSYRYVDVDLIFESYNGYKIPVHAIRTEENGKQKVIGINGNKMYDCECDILYTNTDGGYAVVDSVEDADTKLSQMDRILVGER